MDFAQYIDYVNAAMASDTIGSKISLGIFAFMGVCAILGAYKGVMRGFSKSVIRLFTVGASAVCALFMVMWVSRGIVNSATVGGTEQSVDGILNSYFPGLVDSMPEMVKPILSEMDATTATIFIMMIVAMILAPIFFILFFYTLKLATMFLYQLLSGLSGAISYGRSIPSMIGGGAVGFIQGLGIAAVIIIPISGLCNIAADAREPLIGNSDQPNEYIEQAYETVIDDLADNPIFDLIDEFGGSVAYEKMTTVIIYGEKIDMGQECVDAIKVLSNLLPFTESGFDWMHPTDEQRQALENTIASIDDSELIASLISDVLRGASIAFRAGAMQVDVSGAAGALLDDLMLMFTTCTKDTVSADLDVIVDVYFILCDHDMFDILTSGDPNAVRDLLTGTGPDGKTTIDALLDRLNSYDRSAPIVTSLTKLSFTMMQEALGFDSDTTELYESVKDGINTVLTHNKSDFETEEEYKEAVYQDLDKALADNNLTVDEDIKQTMVDYIADNYGDHEGEITDKEINDALLSYYKAYANSLAGGNESNGDTPEIPEIPGITDIPEVPEGSEIPEIPNP